MTFINALIAILIFLLKFSNEILLKKINLMSEITITINGTGNQKIFNKESSSCDGSSNIYFIGNPSQILINGILQNYISDNVNILEDQINNITMIWNYSLTNCNVMFKGLVNIIKIDLSKFDSSKVTDMKCIFNGCTSLQSIDLSNLDTSSVTNMVAMFSNCKSLKSLDLSNFDTSSVNSMASMFYNCLSLESLDLSSFITSSVNSMSSMFYGCKSLKSLDLSNFDTNEVDGMSEMFKACTSLIKLNLKNFNTQNVTQNIYMFTQVNQSFIYCINESKSSEIKSLLSNFKNNICSENKFNSSQSKLIWEKLSWIDNCTNDNQYKFEYNEICYE